MKHLQLSPPLLIMTMGYPGAGKTFFARQFAELYGLTRISEDRIRFELFEKPRFSKDEFEIIGHVQEYMLEEVMQAEQVIVCDASFLSFKQREKYYELARKKGYRTLTVWLQTDTETSANRAANRDRRNPDSKYSFSITPAIFQSLRTQLERPGEREVAVVISGKHAFKSQCLTVLKKIAGMYSDAITKGEFGVQSGSRKLATNSIRPNQRIVQ